MDYSRLSVKELVEGIKDKKFTSESVVKYFIEQCKQQKDLNAVVEIFEDSIERAKFVDEKIQKGEAVEEGEETSYTYEELLNLKYKLILNSFAYANILNQN